MLESTGEISLNLLKDDSLLIAYSSLRQRDRIAALAQTENIPVKIIKDPQFYLSPEKLKEKLAAEKIADEQAPFWIKIALWSSKTKTGDREELAFDRNEFPLFDSIADYSAEDSFWLKNLQEAEKTPIVLMHHGALAKGLGNKIKREAGRTLIIVEAAKLEDSLTNAFRKKYTEARLRPYFGNKTAIAFGLLGIFYEKYAEPDFFGANGNIILDETSKNCVEWRRFAAACANLPERPEKENLLRALGDEANTVQWVTSFADEIIFQSAPVDLIGIFKEMTGGFKKVLLQSGALTVNNNFDFIKNILGLNDDWQYVQEKQGSNDWLGSLRLEIPKDFPEPNTEGYFRQCCELLLRLTKELGGGILFVLNSKKTIDAVYSAILQPMRQIGAKLLGIGPSGGAGKTISLFLQNPEKSVLLATSQVLAYLDEFKDKISAIAFQKIPFDPPADPIIAARLARFKNGFNDYSLPRAVIRFREILAELGKDQREKTCWLLDSRLLTKDYGKSFIG